MFRQTGHSADAPTRRLELATAPPAGSAARDGLVALALAFVLFYAAGLLLAYRSLQYPWFYDDLHLVRAFSGDELRQALTGNWDVDGLETRGYRPLTVLFNHARAGLFGESVVAHRLFGLGLLAGYLAVLGAAVARLGVPAGQSACAGLFVLTAKNNWWHLVWINDATRVMAGLLVALAALALLSHLARPARWKLPGSVALLAATLLLREEFIAVVLVVPLLGWVGPGRPRRCVAAFGVAVALVVGAFLAARAWLVPGAFWALRLDGWLAHVTLALYPMGQLPASDPLWVVWTAALVLGAGYTALAPPATRQRVSVWLVCLVVTSAPGAVAPRPNLIFFPLTFAALALAELLADLGRRGRAGLALATAVGLLALVSGGVRSVVAQESLHPLSLDRIWAANEFAFGEYAGRATVPPERLARARDELARLGIASRSDFERVYPALAQQAVDEARFAPESGRRVFKPRIHWIAS